MRSNSWASLRNPINECNKLSTTALYLCASGVDAFNNSKITKYQYVSRAGKVTRGR